MHVPPVSSQKNRTVVPPPRRVPCLSFVLLAQWDALVPQAVQQLYALWANKAE